VTLLFRAGAVIPARTVAVSAWERQRELGVLQVKRAREHEPRLPIFIIQKRARRPDVDKIKAASHRVVHLHGGAFHHMRRSSQSLFSHVGVPS
jgi:hypothetical protein